jgi:tetratricopeptide (TPR) repeat protein
MPRLLTEVISNSGHGISIWQYAVRTPLQWSTPMKRHSSRNLFAAALCAAFVACATISSAATPAQSADATARNRQYQKAEALYLSGRLNDAAAAFAELSRKYPNDARVWLKYGNTLTKQLNYDAAATAFQTAINLDPTQGGAALNLALVRLAQAQASLDLAVARLAPGSPEHAQADAIKGQLNSLLGAPDRGAPSR